MHNTKVNKELRIIEKIKEGEARIVRDEVNAATARSSRARDKHIESATADKHYIRGLKDALYIIQKHIS